jgi:hypothetical protein
MSQIPCPNEGETHTKTTGDRKGKQTRGTEGREERDGGVGEALQRGKEGGHTSSSYTHP